MAEQEQWTETETKTIDFGPKWGKWTVRGLLADEDFKLQDKYMTVDGQSGRMNLNTSGMRFAMIQMATIESPHGAKPPSNVLQKLPAGMAERLLKTIKALGNPGEDVGND